MRTDKSDSVASGARIDGAGVFNTLVDMRALASVGRTFFLVLAVILFGCRPSSKMDNGLDRARRLADDGKYEEALQEHISFHDNILTTQPSMYGVRLSFALSEWVELGQKYPKALAALKDVRDKKTVRLAGGETNRDLFHDVASINDHLSEQDKTVALFRKIVTTNPTFARDVYDVAEEALVQKREFALAREYMGDPGRILDRAKTNYERSMAWAKRQTQKRASEEAFRNIFTDDVVRLILILKNTGDEASARKIQAEALQVVADDKIKNALEP